MTPIISRRCDLRRLCSARFDDVTSRVRLQSDVTSEPSKMGPTTVFVHRSRTDE
jgi:hypothetical protein